MAPSSQMFLLDPPEPSQGRSRATDPRTSHIAAEPARTTLKAQVRDRLEQCHGGMTDWELAKALYPDEATAARKKGSVGKRRQELTRWYVVKNPAGERRHVTHHAEFGEWQPVTRPSPDGFPCMVWVLPGLAERAA